jgi:hypothetical protein
MRSVIVLPGDVYTRQMLEQSHRAALLAQLPSVPPWQRPGAASYSMPAARRGRTRRFLLRLRPAHSRL